MQSVSEILQEEFELIRQDLIKKHNELGMKASGQFENELEVFYEESQDRFKTIVKGIDYTQQLQFGRKPGKFPPIAQIEQWIKDKGISFVERDIKLKQLAYLIARKIAREGTKYFQQGGTDLVDSVVTDERFERILRRIEGVSINVFTNTLLDRYIQLAA